MVYNRKHHSTVRLRETHNQNIITQIQMNMKKREKEKKSWKHKTNIGSHYY
jgi:hypothetical protein